MVTIRQATLDDLETLVRFRIALLRAIGNLQNEADEETLIQANRNHFARTLATQEYRSWVAEVDHEIVGCGGLLVFIRQPMVGNLSGKEAYILNIYTLPQWRNQGIARMLLTTIVNIAKEADIRRIWLRAAETVSPLYEKHGFVVTNEEMEYTWE